ncbi:MAG: phosphoglycerate kinase [Cyclobacteriaceae bacterium]|nr:phosphoglycerate kinase [Cyclobacteriaceae bacterium]
MKTIDDIQFKGLRALVRVDFNVPLNDAFEVTDFTRINAAEPTIKKILADGGSVVLMSHLGRPKGEPEEKFSLKHLIPKLSKRFGINVKFANDCIGIETEKMANNLNAGEILLLENLRYYPEETKGDKDFAQKLSKLGDVYINDAFGTAHRAHASTSIIAQFFDTKGCGYVMQSELENAAKVLKNPKKPFTAIMGGAKISDKIIIIEKLLDKVDNLIIGGGMAYTFFKALGGNIGSSLVEESKLELARELIKKAKAKNVSLELPIDSIIADDFAANANTKISDNISIPDGWMGLDIGPDAQEVFRRIISRSATILWNGPMGVFEMPAFAEGTRAVAKAVRDATAFGGFSLIGGGDSAAAVNQMGYGDKVSYVSTGGGALLEFMEGKVLPGVAALEE